MMTPAQCRAARALLGWSQQRLTAASGVDQATLDDFEGGRAVLPRATLTTLLQALEAAGIDFVADGQVSGVAGAGVRLKFPAQIVKRIDVLENEGGPVGEDDLR